MIHTNRTVTVGKQESIIDSPIILYRGDREVEVEFTLSGNKFTFTNRGNVIESMNATHGQLVINTPTGENMFSEVSTCNEGRVVFLITKEMIDELIEIGFYSFQIRLFDESQVSRVTIPPVYQGIDIRNPIAAEDETDLVDVGVVDYSVIRKDEFEELATFLPGGAYNKTEWQHHDVISQNRLNKIEDAIYFINDASEINYVSIVDQINRTNQSLNDNMDRVENELFDEMDIFKNDMNVSFTNLENTMNESISNLENDVTNSMNSVKNELFVELDILGNNMIEGLTNLENDIKNDMSKITILLDDYSDLSENGENWSPALQKALDDIAGTGGEILLSNAIYKFNEKVIIAPTLGDTDYSACRKFKIRSNNKTTLEYYGEDDIFFECGKTDWRYTMANPAKGYIDIALENIILMNLGVNDTTGVDVANVRKVSFEDLEVRGFNKGIKLKGTWYGSQLKRVVIWLAAPIANSKGLVLDSGVNNTSFENVAVLNFDNAVYMCPTDASGGVSTCGFRNCNFEFNNIAIHIYPLNQNVGSINIDGCHFEYNKNIMTMVNINTIWNVNLKNSLLMYGGINIEGIDSTAIDARGFVKGVSISNNVFLGDEHTYIIDLGSTIPDKLEAIHLGVNQYNGLYDIRKPLIQLNSDNTPHFFETMPLYSCVNQIPWGRDDTKGTVGEFRHDSNNLYFKSIEGWVCIPFNRQYNYDGDKNNINTWAQIEGFVMPATSNITKTIMVDGVKEDFEYVVMISPSGWLEDGITFHAYKAGKNSINIRFTNHSTVERTIASQRYNIICQVSNF